MGDITIASYAPTGFDKLTRENRLLAYHLAMASLAGDTLFSMQSSRYGGPATELVLKLMAKKDKLDPAFAEKLSLYRKQIYMHHGIHDSITGHKFLPPFTKKELTDAAKSLKVTIAPDLLVGMFDPKVAPNLTNKSPGPGKDPLTESAANHYEGVTSKDLQGFEDKYPLNGRVVKGKGGKILEQVYRAGGEGAPPGLAAKELGRVVKHLEDAAKIAMPAQKEALDLLVRYLKTGDKDLFQKHDITWLKQVFPVDYIMGFVETYTDIRERKGSWESFVAIPDPDRDPPLQALVKAASYFEQKMPWDAKYKRESFNPPAAAAVTVLAANGDGGPFTFLGVNLPNGQDLRAKYGSKNFVVLSTGDVRADVSGSKTIDEFAPEESRAEMHRCSKYLDYAITSFHEVTGHGSGKVDAGLKGDPAQLLAPYYSTMEEGRAELVAEYLSGDPKTVEIGLLPDVGCQKIVPAYVAMSVLLRHRWVPEGDVVEEDHFRAELIENNTMIEKGIVKEEKRNGKTFLIVKDVEAWRKAHGELLAEHQRIKATGDKEALKALVEKYGVHLNAAWRDEVRARLKALDLPRAIAMIPPILTPIKDASGAVVDAKAEQSTSLDAYLAALEAAQRD